MKLYSSAVQDVTREPKGVLLQIFTINYDWVIFSSHKIPILSPWYFLLNRAALQYSGNQSIKKLKPPAQCLYTYISMLLSMIFKDVFNFFNYQQ